VISDDGVSTMFDLDERGNSGWDIAARALERAGGGGTFVLNLPARWEELQARAGPYATLRRARDEQGWPIYRVASWEDLIEVARRFSQARYGAAAPASG